MGLHVSGKRALIRIIPPTGVAFDASGVSADGRARANEFSFSIQAQVVEVDGYNQAYTEPVPVGQSKVSGSMTLFYNQAANEANAVLETLYVAQHAPDDCDDPAAYALDIMPEGECVGKELWHVSAFVVENLELPMAHDGVLVISFNWHGWVVNRCILLSGVEISGEDEVDEGDSEEYIATVTPEDHTPLTVTWSPVPDSGQGTLVATYEFLIPGTITLTVTVADRCGRTKTDTFDVEVVPGS